ncbi:beta strand repeat-containing protein, partial [Azospirillum isscasi]|nr:hypothetical protein [Azospirillum isscasi]
NVAVTVTDNAGNATTQGDTTNATVDNQAPTVTDGNIAISGGTGTGGAYKTGDTVTATWNNTLAGDNNTDTLTGVTFDLSAFGGGSAVAGVNNNGVWTATHTITAGSLDATSRNVAVTVTDNAGNSTTQGDTTNATVDNQAPTVTDGNIAISGGSGIGGAYKAGDIITATWDNTLTGDNNTDTLTGVTFDLSAFGGGSAVAGVNNGGVWTVTHTVTAGSLDATGRNVAVTVTDNAGNVTTTSDTTNATVDNRAPTVTDGNIAISGGTGTGGAYKTGDTVTATWDNTLAGDNNTDTLAGVTFDLSAFGGGSAVAGVNNNGVWTATHTVTAGSLDATGRNVAVTVTDNAGNATTQGDTTNATVDNRAPTVTDGNIAISGGSGIGGAYKAGDIITATWDNTLTGDNNTDTLTGVTFDLSAFGGGSAVAGVNNGGVWTVTHTVTAGSLDATGRNVAVTVTDNAGNVTTTSDTTNATVDNRAPTVTDGNIAISGGTGAGGAYKAGDTVTATWDNTLAGDNNTDTLAGVTFDLSAFGGGSAVAATNNNGVWTATHTITAGSLDATGRNAAVTVTDNAGNSTTQGDTTNAVVDNQAPTVTDGNIAISGGTGTGGAYKTGDTVTATWNNTLAGDNNTDTLAGVTVDFSQFGGGSAVAATNNNGVWTATHTITAGS